MIVVRDKRTGKFLKRFSGSLNDFESRTRYKYAVRTPIVPTPQPERPGQYVQTVNVKYPTRQETFGYMCSADTIVEAKIYASKGSAASSFYSFCYRRVETPGEQYGYRYERVPLAEVLPWLEFVDVAVYEKRRAAALRAAATRKSKAKPKAKGRAKAKRKLARV